MLRVRAHFDFEREFSRRRFRLTLFEAKRTVPAASHQPEGRELLVEWCTGCNTQDVSILSQPEGRELLRYTFMSFELQHDALSREPDTVDSCKTTQIPNYRSNFDAFFDQTRLNMVSYTLSSDTRTKANLPGNCHTL